MEFLIQVLLSFMCSIEVLCEAYKSSVFHIHCCNRAGKDQVHSGSSCLMKSARAPAHGKTKSHDGGKLMVDPAKLSLLLDDAAGTLQSLPRGKVAGKWKKEDSSAMDLNW